MHIYIYIYREREILCTHMCIYIYIYIHTYSEREREIERDVLINDAHYGQSDVGVRWCVGNTTAPLTRQISRFCACATVSACYWSRSW